MKRFVALVLILSPSSAFAWNRPGHMVIGAIAYHELKEKNPQEIPRVIEILKAHPDFKRWQPALDKALPKDQDLVLFMLAGTWPDDIRRTAYDHPTWHYVNIPIHPGNDATPQIPGGESILTAYKANLEILKSTAPDSEKAIALCWIFHLVGDIHQPLHAVHLVSDQFPKGDRGGNDFYIRAEDNKATIKLHAFWDGLISGTNDTRNAERIALRLRGKKMELPELAEKDFEKWAWESFRLAKESAYNGGTLTPGAADNGNLLPDGYARKAKEIGERRCLLGALRLASILDAKK